MKRIGTIIAAISAILLINSCKTKMTDMNPLLVASDNPFEAPAFDKIKIMVRMSKIFLFIFFSGIFINPAKILYTQPVDSKKRPSFSAAQITSLYNILPVLSISRVCRDM